MHGQHVLLLGESGTVPVTRDEGTTGGGKKAGRREETGRHAGQLEREGSGQNDGGSARNKEGGRTEESKLETREDSLTLI